MRAEILTDNGSAYRSRLWRDTHHQLGIRDSHTRVRRPQTNCEAAFRVVAGSLTHRPTGPILVPSYRTVGRRRQRVVAVPSGAA